MVYRYGGEEILIILPEQSLETAVIATERVRKRVEQRAIPHGGINPPGVVTISAGVAALHADGRQNVEVWLRQADYALYRAKSHGRNRVEVYNGGCVERCGA